ncbi:MAG TPA: hypothetical protein VFB44_13580 [Thermoleophilaceae bacterium]|nr:hypothetical protein [Thermoleophilaceae bacterium]
METNRDFERHEEDAAAEEAAEIGGPGPEYEGADDERAVEEGGGGESEGFEQAEEGLVEAAQHGEHRHMPTEDEFPPEEASDQSTAEYGEADQVDPNPDG